MFEVNNQMLITTSARPSLNHDCCHSISAGYMQAWIHEIITNPVTNAATKETELQKIAIALRTPPGVGAPNLLPTTDQCRKIHDLCIAVNVDDKKNSANELYADFFNEANNLRMGSSTWNRAVKELYDPRSWIHIDIHRNVDFWNNPSAVPANFPPGINQCFLLTDDQDNRRISNIANIDAVTPLAIASNRGYLNMAPIQFVYSSDNNFYPDPGNNLTAGDPVYFFNYNTHQWTRI